METEINMMKLVKNLPNEVTGTRSPYPTVVKVSTANHNVTKHK